MKYKDVEIVRGGKTHSLREYEVGYTFGAKVKYLLENSAMTEDVMCCIFDAEIGTLYEWADGLTLPDNRNIITVINKYFRYAYEKNNQEEDNE